MSNVKDLISKLVLELKLIFAKFKLRLITCFKIIYGRAQNNMLMKYKSHSHVFSFKTIYHSKAQFIRSKSKQRSGRRILNTCREASDICLES